MQIRNASLHDIPALQAFQKEAWLQDYVPFLPAGYAQKGLAKYGAAELIAERIQSSPCYLVAGHAKGLAACLEMLRLDDTTLELWWLHVSHDFRGDKWGQKMVQSALTKMPTSTKTVHVTTFKDNVRAIRFYEQLGFVVDAFYCDEIGNDTIAQCRLTYACVIPFSNQAQT